MLLVAAPPLIRAMFRLRRTGGTGPQAVASKGWNGMTTLTAPVRVPVSISRRYLAAGTFILLGLIDIFIFGLFAHRGDATLRAVAARRHAARAGDPRARRR